MAKAMPGSKVEVVPVCYKLQLTTDTTTSLSYLDVDLPLAVKDYGPHLDSIIAYTSSENMTTNFRWLLAFYWSIDGRRWSPTTPTALFSEVSTNGDIIQTPYSANFGPNLRIVIGVRNNAGTAVERGVVTAALAFVFKS